MGGQETPGLFGEIEQDRAGFPQDETGAVRPCIVDDHRGLVVRVEREKFGRQLIARQDVDRIEPPFESHFQKRDRDLARIGGRAAIPGDHRLILPARASASAHRLFPARPSTGRGGGRFRASPTARATVVLGKSVSYSYDLGGRNYIQQKKTLD